MRLSRVSLLAVLSFSLVAVSFAPPGGSVDRGVVLAAQETHQPPQQQMPGISPLDQPNAIPDSLRERMEQDRLRAANDDRHKRLAADADKLIALSNELKADIDKTNKDELSMEVMRKAAEIEKLAHDVQGRMKNP